jgi:Zn-finger in ubiquitin-hydrolases and other protein
MTEACEHFDQASYFEPTATVCKECVEMGSGWVHLRQCLVCGHVGCCDSSPNRHETKHFETIGHQVIRSLEPAEDWGFCYVDDLFVDHVLADR